MRRFSKCMNGTAPRPRGTSETSVDFHSYRKWSRNTTCSAQCVPVHSERCAVYTRTNSNQNMNLNQLNGCKRIKWILALRSQFFSSRRHRCCWQASHECAYISRYFSVCFIVDSVLMALVLLVPAPKSLPSNERRDFRISTLPSTRVFPCPPTYIGFDGLHGIVVKTRQPTSRTKHHFNPVRLMILEEAHIS